MLIRKFIKACVNIDRRIGTNVFLKRSISSSITPNAKHNKKKSFEKERRPTKEAHLNYEEESDHYLLNELRNLDAKYKSQNKQVPQIIQQFSGVLNLYGLNIVSAPLPGLNNLPYDYIHLFKNIGKQSVEILLDSRCENINDAQMIIADETKSSQLLYLMGSFTRERGFAFYSAMLLDATKIGKDSAEMSRAICSAEPWIFRALNNYYEKQLDINHPEVMKFLTFQTGETNMPELDGKLLIDALLNYTATDLVYDNHEDSAKLNSIVSMLVSYCQNSAYGRWIHNFKSFIES